MAPFVRQGSGLLLALLLAWSGVARAVVPLPRLLPLTVRPQEGVLEKSAVKFNSLLVEELRTRDADFQLLAPMAAGQKPRMPTSKPAPEALAAMDRARKAMKDLDLRNAVAEYYQAVTLYLGDAATADFDAVNEAFLNLSVAAFRLGREKEAERALGNLYRLNPGLKLPAGKYPPIFLRVADRARDRLERGARGSLVVDGPIGARAFVDGKVAGPVPVTLARMYAGEHYVMVEGIRGERWGKVVEIGPDPDEVRLQAVFQTEADLALMSTQPPDAQPVLDTAFEQRLRAYCQTVDAQYALVPILLHTDDHRFVVASALYSAQLAGFSVLEQRTVDELMKGANLEAFRLADSVVGGINAFGEPAILPVSLKVKPSATGASELGTARSDPAARDAARPRLIPQGPPTGASQDPDLPQASRASGSGGPRGGGGGRQPQDGEDQFGEGIPWWGWTLIGLGAGLAVGGATIAIVQANRPISGTVVVRW